MTIRVKISLNIDKKESPTHRVYYDVSGIFSWS